MAGPALARGEADAAASAESVPSAAGGPGGAGEDVARLAAEGLGGQAAFLGRPGVGRFEVLAAHGTAPPGAPGRLPEIAARAAAAGFVSLGPAATAAGAPTRGGFWALGAAVPEAGGEARGEAAPAGPAMVLLVLGRGPRAGLGGGGLDARGTLAAFARLAGRFAEAEADLRRGEAAARAARDTERLLIDYLNTAIDGVWQTDADHRFLSTTTDLSRLNVSQQRFYGRTVWELAGGDPERDAVMARLRGHFEARQPFRGFEYAFPDDRGAPIWREVNGNPVTAYDGTFLGFRGTSRDITDRKLAEAELRETNNRLAALSRSGVVGIIVGQGDWIVESNDEFLRIVGLARADLPGGRLHRRAVAPAHHGVGAGPLAAEFDAQGVWGPVERDLVRRDGARAPVLVSSILLDRSSQRWMCLVQDISERKRAEARIRELADRDTLTGLMNRRSFMERFADTLREVPRRTAGGALILLDLDHFKDVNDSLGHDAGDALLCEVAVRLNRSVRQHDEVARLGGDEFAVLIHDILEAEEVDAIARRILEHLRRPFAHDGRLLYAGASAGVVLYPGDGRDAKQLLKNADIALYRSKARGRRTVNFFDPHMLAEYEDRLALDAELQRAFADREFTLAFQPIVRLADGAHAGFEALLRWNHPARGLLSPASFIGNLEQSGLIVPVGRFVLESALAQVRAWLDEGLEPGRMSVNVAAAQLRQADLVADIAAQLELHRLEPSRLRVEITENVLLEDSPEIETTLEALHSLGLAIALDDFGTGFASLSHLKKVPVNVLKIDRSFVRDIGIDADDAAISRTIVTLAHSLGMRVVAEGVTTAEALAFLRANRCDEGQGYLFARPLLAGETRAYMRRGGFAGAPSPAA